jgi:hypothetical protein
VHLSCPSPPSFNSKLNATTAPLLQPRSPHVSLRTKPAVAVAAQRVGRGQQHGLWQRSPDEWNNSTSPVLSRPRRAEHLLDLGKLYGRGDDAASNGFDLDKPSSTAMRATQPEHLQRSRHIHCKRRRDTDGRKDAMYAWDSPDHIEEHHKKGAPYVRGTALTTSRSITRRVRRAQRGSGPDESNEVWCGPR